MTLVELAVLAAARGSLIHGPWSFCTQALYKSVKDGDLPMAGSVLWVQHMVPGRPPGTTLDVKKSQHKKMSKLLQVMVTFCHLYGAYEKPLSCLG
jgi:translation initiation factor 2D